ncbi:Ammonia channel [bacterium HR19]|nr:Ammonia channel [bacterium HR19]
MEKSFILNLILISELDSGDTAWLLTSSAFVMLMTLPALALFYGGLARVKGILNTMGMSFSAYAITSVVWVVISFSLAFGDDIYGIIGNMKFFLLSGVKPDEIASGTKIPVFLYCVFQLTFAAITVALVSGSLIDRIKFSSWCVFVIMWGILVYAPIAHWVWGGGFLAKLGALDFAGGTVVHVNAGMAGLAGALALGRRKKQEILPNNVPAVITGAGLLWFGWFGFNAGSAVAASGLASSAFLSTNTATAVAAISWMLTEWILRKKPTLVGLSSGAVSGLVAITPASGYVDVSGAILIGVLAGVIPFFAVAYLKPALKYDDALDVFGIHGVSGAIGAIMTGVLANPQINSAGTGLIYGNPKQVVIQIIATAVSAVYSFIMSFIIFKIIDVLIGLRVKEDEEVEVDKVIHGESAYHLSESE